MSEDDAIRKALEQRLKAQQAALLAAIPPAWRAEILAGGFSAGEFPIKWPNITFAKEKAICYLQFTFHPTVLDRPELGKNSRIERGGHALISVRVPEGVGDDIAGRLVKIIENAYPYTDALVAEGMEVRIELVDPTQGVPTDGKWYRPVYVHWNVSRRPS